ncbi:hypothetical protein HNQ56_002670 [Anaerotaenia torta]|uniref:hypothetical protein n=1 Tax=Anaerotaenia torta TaxID=433293 RepID=UPI003D224809
MKKKLCVFFILLAVTTCNTSTFIALANNTPIDSEAAGDVQIIDEIYLSPAKVIIIPDEKTLCVKATPMEITPTADGYSYALTNINRITYNDFYPLTNYGAGPATITFTGGSNFTVSGGLSVAVGFSEIVTATVGFNASASYTVSATEGYSANIPTGYKGRIVMRYYQQYVSFNQVTMYLNMMVSTTPGYVWGAPYDPYYTLQLISL